MASGSSPKPPISPLGSSATIISVRARCGAAGRAMHSENTRSVDFVISLGTPPARSAHTGCQPGGALV